MLPEAAPMVGSSTVTEFGTVSPAEKLRFDVPGRPVASPGRTDKKPGVDGPTTVTLATMPVAPAGTGDWAVSVTSSLRGLSDVNGPVSPRSVRVSSTRTGEIAISAEGGLAALAVKSPPAPSVMATAAPTAAHRERIGPKRVVILGSSGVLHHAG